MSRRHALIVAMLVTTTAIPAAQGRGIVWNLSIRVTERDKKDILRLAAELGIRTPQRVTDDHGSCPIVSVLSEPVVDGNRVTTTFLWMRPRTGKDCRPYPSEPTTYRRGRWITDRLDDNPRQGIAWRIRDGEWHRDVSLGTDVRYEDAQSIILAIRRRTYVDSRSADDIAKQGPPTINPDRIVSVARRRDPVMERLFPDLYRDVYEVTDTTHDDFTGRGGGGHVLFVKIQNDRVEVHATSMWTS